ncbi:hypothetical protein [uncultured Sulfitobacter sp.]|uniref:hypothetical protein n=1 Tax=uncultured Sulfitobacter sp. TaxID=191468 RepID=UPI0026046198|nr:hypothetical protein [uncultured Sulfitobacter sp.]
MNEKERRVFKQKSFWDCYRLLLIFAGMLVFMCTWALIEDWSGRHRYIIPPVPVILATIVVVVFGGWYHHKRNLIVILDQAFFGIETFGKRRELAWDGIRNIRHTAEGLDLTFGALFLSKFVVIEYDGKDIEIPTHKLRSGHSLHDNFSDYYFNS